MWPAKVVMFAAIITVIGGCATPAQRRAAENAAIQKEAAAEISRICALPKPEREAELKKLKEEAGVAIYCGTEQPDP